MRCNKRPHLFTVEVDIKKFEMACIEHNSPDKDTYFVVTTKKVGDEYIELEFPTFEFLPKNTGTLKVKIDDIYYKININQIDDVTYKVRILNRTPFCYGKVLNAIYKKGAIDRWKIELESMKRTIQS